MRASSVYFATCWLPNGVDTGMIKVGVSVDTESRLPGLGTGNPLDHRLFGEVPGDYFSECLAHLILRPFKVRGEYFWFTPDCRAVVEQMISQECVHASVADGGEPRFCVAMMDVRSGMRRLRVSLDELAVSYGRRTSVFKTLQDNKPVFSRPLMAAVVLAAVKKGRRVVMPDDFLKPRFHPTAAKSAATASAA